jgi:hypothetical protein
VLLFIDSAVESAIGAMRNYHSKKWLQFREAVLRLDGSLCCRCHRGPPDGVILQVHHKNYIVGRKPWDYPYDACEVLCKGCHAEEHGKIPPTSDWSIVGHDDLGDLSGACDYCGTAIRYVFCIQHKKWPTLEVGEICCDNLTSTKSASSYMDVKRRNLERRKRFVSSSRWKTDNHGAFRLRQCGINVAVLQSDGAFKLQMNGVMGQLRFASMLEARMKAFDFIESGDATRFFSKRRPNGAKRNLGFGPSLQVAAPIALRSSGLRFPKNEMAGENPGHDASNHVTAA